MPQDPIQLGTQVSCASVQWLLLAECFHSLSCRHVMLSLEHDPLSWSEVRLQVAICPKVQQARHKSLVPVVNILGPPPCQVLFQARVCRCVSMSLHVRITLFTGARYVSKLGYARVSSNPEPSSAQVSCASNRHPRAYTDQLDGARVTWSPPFFSNNPARLPRSLPPSNCCALLDLLSFSTSGPGPLYTTIKISTQTIQSLTS